jgi:DNA polymerase-3 subunit epsilon
VGRATQPIAFVDVETTGGRAALHRITEIAIIGMDAGEVQWRWSSLVNPGVRIPSGIERLTGITNEMVAEAPEFSALAPEISRRLEGRRFVAHNARFDYGFVRNEFRRIGRSFTAPVTCTVRLSRALFPDSPRHSLDAIMSRHGLECDRRHRALPDAEVLAQFWQLLLQSQSSQTLEAAIDEVSRRPSLPSHLSADLLDDLPDGPGVYRFWGESEAEGETLLYVGKANNLRERVLSHFGVALRDGKAQRLAQQVRRVDWHETAGELGALLLEARWVKEQQPVYNRRLRGRAQPQRRNSMSYATPGLLTGISTGSIVVLKMLVKPWGRSPTKPSFVRRYWGWSAVKAAASDFRWVAVPGFVLTKNYL